MIGHIAAQIARDGATDQSSAVFKECSAKMCWDAAIACQVRAGLKQPKPVTTADHDHVISLKDKPVTNPSEMNGVPQGASIGFFRGEQLVHFMIATGAGLAAGNKNACIGIGNPGGWEILNLAKIKWEQGGFMDGAKRLTFVRYRPID